MTDPSTRSAGNRPASPESRHRADDPTASGPPEGDAHDASGPFSPPAVDTSSGARGARPGGGPLRSPVELITESLNAVGANPAGYLLAGLGVALVILPLTVGAVLVPYVGMGVGMFAGMAAGDEDVGVLLGLLGFVALLFVAIIGIVLVTYPLYASLMRAIWLHQLQGEPLGIGAAYSTPLQDFGRVMGVMLLVTAAATVGALFCYLPALAVGLVFQFALPSVVIDGMSPVAAMRRSFDHAVAHFSWHLGIFFIGLGVLLVVSQIPLLGIVAAAPLAFDFQLRAYRNAFPV